MQFKKLGELNKEVLEISNFYNIVANVDHYSVLHAHNAYEIMLCREGSFIFVYNDEKNEKSEIILSKGQFVLVNAGVFHYIKLKDRARILNVEFIPIENTSLDRVELRCDEIFSLNDVLKSIKQKNQPFYIFEDLANVEYEIAKLVDGMINLDEGVEKTLLYRIQLIAILLAVSHCTIYETNNKIGIIHVKKALEFIKEEFKNNISAFDVAKNCNVNADYLQRLVKKETGKNITQIISEYRIKYAKLLLTSRKDLSLDKIAASCGYSGRSSLNYEFKKLVGKAPQDYKNEALSRQVRKDLLPQIRIEEVLPKK